ncbi:MAG: IS1595 family transposase, partial [Deltaproteobacteria bacterium]|nr:IS1595 family transposase [Deltaproteobacteria bacterium]
KFRGLSKSTFYLHLKECEFRFNHRGQNLYKLLLKIIRKSPLN